MKFVLLEEIGISWDRRINVIHQNPISRHIFPVFSDPLSTFPLVAGMVSPFLDLMQRVPKQRANQSVVFFMK